MVGIYISGLIGIRIGGRRTVSQMSAFDFVVTVAVGTIVSSTALSPTPSLLEGIVALATLLALQTLLGAARSRWQGLKRVIDLPPLVLVRDGEIRHGAMKDPQMTRNDLLERLRQEGVYGLEEARLVVLEANGQLSIVRDPRHLDREAITILGRLAKE